LDHRKSRASIPGACVVPHGFCGAKVVAHGFAGAEVVSHGFCGAGVVSHGPGGAVESGGAVVSSPTSKKRSSPASLLAFACETSGVELVME